MKKFYILFFSLICLFFLNGEEVIAQVIPPSGANGHIFAEIIPVFSASEKSQMNFGRFSPGPKGGQIILTPESTVSVIGSVYKDPGTYNAASFYVTGDTDAAFTISLPADPVVLKHLSSSKTLQVKDWVSIPASGIETGILQDGYQVVSVGATLKVGTLNDNPVGIYTGSYSITFDFN